jgi:hypothetical protein
MTCIDITAKRRRSATLAAGIALSALLVLGAGIGTARADDRDRDHRGWERQENHAHRGHWTGGYYRAPPVVYYHEPAPTYYYRQPPPVYYGSGIGVTLPGVNLNFH